MKNENLTRLSIYLSPEDLAAIHDERERLRREQNLRVTTSQAAAAMIRGAIKGAARAA